MLVRSVTVPGSMRMPHPDRTRRWLEIDKVYLIPLEIYFSVCPFMSRAESAML